MPSIRRKLTSKSGISMAMALVFFLLCAMVGAVVLSAASVAAGTVSRERVLSQRTMSLTSAAELLAKEIPKMAMTQDCIMTQTVTTTVTTEGEKPVTKVDADTSYASQTPVLTAPEFLRGITITVPPFPSDPTPPSDPLAPPDPPKLNVLPPTPLTITITGPSEEEFSGKIPDVTGTLSFDQNFSITVRLSCGPDNAATMVFPAHTQMESPVIAVTKSEDKTTTTTTYTFTVTWGTPEITEGVPTEEGGSPP